MAVTQTNRLNLYRWSSGADQFTRAQMTESHDNLDSTVAGYSQGDLPTGDLTNYVGFFHYTSGTSDAGTLYYCNGLEWFPIGNYGAASSLDGSLSDGISANVARADHTHSLDDDIISTSKIVNYAVTSDKISDSSVVTSKIAAGAVNNSKLASDLDASKLTAGTLPVARIATGSLDTSKLADNAVTAAKLRDSSALSVVGNPTNLTADPSDIVAATDGHILRRSGTSIGFGTILSSNISDLTESVQDIAGGMVDGGTETGITVTYNDSSGKLNFTVNDDGHNHVITNVDGLQTALDGKVSDTGDTITGTLTVGGTGQYLRFKDTTDNSHYGQFAASLTGHRTYTFPNYNGTVVLSSHSGDLDVTGDIYVGTSGGGDSRIYFHDDNTNVERVLFWDDSANDWRVTDNGGTTRVLYHSGNIPSYAASSHSHSYLSTSGGTVSGNLTVTGNTTTQGNMFIGKHLGGDSWTYYHDDNSNAWRAFGWDDSENRFWVGGSAKVDGFLDVTGDIYVGTSGGGDSRIYFHDDNSNTERTFFWDDSVNDWRVEDNNGTIRTLYHSGNIPSYAAASHGHYYAAVSHTHDYAASSHSHTYVNRTNGEHYGTLKLYASSTVGVGILKVGNPTDSGSGNVRVETNNANQTNFVADTKHGGLSGAYYVFSIYHYGVNKGSIAHNGSTTSYNTTSDYRIKENIVDLNDGLSVVNSMRPRRFTFKDNPNDTRVHTGFIAHELQEVMPEIVIGEKDAVEEDGVTIKPQVVDKSGVVAVLVSAVQELSARTEALEAQLASM